MVFFFFGLSDASLLNYLPREFGLLHLWFWQGLHTSVLPWWSLNQRKINGQIKRRPCWQWRLNVGPGGGKTAPSPAGSLLSLTLRWGSGSSQTRAKTQTGLGHARFSCGKGGRRSSGHLLSFWGLCAACQGLERSPRQLARQEAHQGLDPWR